MEDKAKTKVTSPTSLHHGVAQFMHLTVICLPVKRRRSAGLGVISVADVIRSDVCVCDLKCFSSCAFDRFEL